MKIAINRCFGGFSLSAAAVRRMAELSGRKCYFFKNDPDDFEKHILISEKDANGSLFWSAYDIPNPDEVCGSQENWHSMTDEERRLSNDAWGAHSLENRPTDRQDPLLIRVIEELGGGPQTGASGPVADLAIVEIPDGVEYTIEEYDGLEHIAEVHRTWR